MTKFNVVGLQHCRLLAPVSGLLVTVLLTGVGNVRAGKLDDTRSAVRDDASRNHADDSNSGDSDDDDDDSSGAVLACFIPFILPFCLIATAVDDDNGQEEDQNAYFLPYPYAGNHLGRMVTVADLETGPISPVSVSEMPPSEIPNGFENEDTMVISETTDPLPALPASVSRVGGRLSAEYYYDIDTIHVPGFSFLVDSSSRVGFETEWRLFLEPMEIGWDQLWMGMFNLNIRFIQSPMLEARLGLGGRLMIADGVDGGFNSTFSFDVYPIRPLLIAAQMHLGNLGHAFFLEGQLALGVTLGHAALFAGYRATLIQGQSEGVFFHGPMAGVTAWF